MKCTLHLFLDLLGANFSADDVQHLHVCPSDDERRETCIEYIVSLLCLVSKVMTERRLQLLLLHWKFCR